MDKISELKALLSGKLNKDSSKEDIDFIADVTTKLDAIKADYDKVVSDKQDITERFIKATRNEGSTKPEQEEQPSKPRSLEEIGQALLEKDNK